MQRAHRVGVAQLQRVGEAEQAGADRDARRQPVAEDHRGEADEAAAAGLALLVAARRLEHEVGPAEPGERRPR